MMAKCTQCGSNKTVLSLRSTDRSFCENCFRNFFEKRFKRTIRRNSLLRTDDNVAVALSGGKDSVVLTYLLKKISIKAPKSKLFAITIDEGVKGYSKKTVGVAKEVCGELGIEHHIFTYKEEFGENLDEMLKKTKRMKTAPAACSFCGVFRRRLLNARAKELGATKVATGHNLNDEVQVALMNFIRGDVERLARMGAMVGMIKDEGFIPRIKPLRESPEEEVRLYGKLVGLPVSFSKCPHSYDAFRGTMRDLIDKLEERHKGSMFQILKSTDSLIPILREHYKDKAKETPKKCKSCGELTSREYCKVCQMKEELSLV